MKASFYLFLTIFVLGDNAFGQSLPDLEIGSIASLTYKNSQSGASPLKINNGNGGFFHRWVILFGAKINGSLSLYAEIETVKGLQFINYGLSAMYRPNGWNYLNLEAGKFLVPFGTFLRRRWDSENPLIGLPLLYEYRTGLSAFDLPKNESELLRVRGQGESFQYHSESSETRLDEFVVTFSGHIPRPGSGLRIISREVYLTGVQIFGTGGRFDYNFGITNGALSNPADINNSSAVQILARMSYNPFIGLNLATSVSWGSYLDKESVNSGLQDLGKSVEDFRQITAGVDVSYSIGHLVFYSEFILNRWQTPFIEEDLDALAFYVEGKYTFLTRFYIAGRFSQIDFMAIDDPSDIDGDGQFRESWDHDIRQLELGLGYRINRNALFKLATQLNRTQGVLEGDPDDDLVTLQLVVFF
ncbi:hypothetical protein GWN26_04125 [Candidatus Saccharibacteria bacterium]|nr:hypothetical protein [Candidatus Saccharibacteria bacterium]NIW78657.1 hypothetical protein [Calditrichia bacterium]